MAKIVRSKRLSRVWKPIGIGVAAVVALSLAIGIVGWITGRSAEQSRARDFYYYAPPVAAACVYHTTSGEVGFSRDFMMCVIRREYVRYRDTPSGVCMRFEEKSREQVWCIIDAENAAETRIQVGDLTRRVEAEQKAAQAERDAQRAKRDAEEKAIAPVIQKAIESLNPRDDTERRYAAISVSCKYTQEEAGYRVAYQAYAHASQKGVDAARRFEGGRYAICNENQVKGR